jgi:EAL domain-containing protein (putative c-di-GMP-specific phosphodiesterase class I)
MKRLLILDDDPVILGLLSRALRRPGVELITCRELEAAEAVLGSLPVDLMMADLCLSPLGGLEGVRLLKHLAANFPAMQLVVVSGNVDPPVVELCRRTANAAVFPKPVDLDRLRDHLAEHLAPEPGSPASAVDVEELDGVLDSGAVRAVLQPIVPLAGGAAHGYESLARGPESSLLRNPEILFAYAARKDRLYETDALCIRAALEESRWLGPETPLFINVQPRSLTRPGFAGTLARTVEEAGRSPRRVILELTEQQTILNQPAFASALADLRGRGFRVALDDYGVGYSNLQLLEQLHPDYLKIDGHFCRELPRYRSKQVIVGSTARMAASLGIPTIIEHVETAEESDCARALGVNFGQGYLFAKPAPGRSFAQEPLAARS